jgi:LEA14-like dessication related protein
MTLKVTNPNRESLTLDGVYYELSVQGKALLSGTSNKSVTIAGYDASQVQLTADVSMFNVIRLLGGLMQAPQPDDLPYKFYSKISVREFKIPVYYTTEGSVGQELFGTAR